jgi:hypothetical protein
LFVIQYDVTREIVNLFRLNEFVNLNLLANGKCLRSEQSHKKC